MESLTCQFFHRQHLYYIDEWNNCYVHGGFDRHQVFKGQRPEVYYWDRDLWSAALSYNAYERHQPGNKFRMITEFNEIFIGHTSTVNWKTDKPMKAANIYNLFSSRSAIPRTMKINYLEIKLCNFWF